MERCIKAFEKSLVTKITENDNYTVKDLIVLAKKPVEEYLGLILDKIQELKVFHDTTDSILMEQLTKILTVVWARVNDAITEIKKGVPPSSIISTIELELNLLNAYKQRVEVEEGLLSCPKCKRWYPIVETIPQMLPDNLRNQKKDLEFLVKWQARVPSDILQSGQPWHL